MENILRQFFLQMHVSEMKLHILKYSFIQGAESKKKKITQITPLYVKFDLLFVSKR